MSRCIVNVATGPYVRGQKRLKEMTNGTPFMAWENCLPPGSPTHRDVPYAFKAFAMKAAAGYGHSLLLWADASVIPNRDLSQVWEKIEREGALIFRNGWTNYEWTAESAYRDLFRITGVAALEMDGYSALGELSTEEKIAWNREVPHVVATVFGLNLKHHVGNAIFSEYFSLAEGSRAFCGPWWNSNHPEYSDRPGAMPCGPCDVRGHRHDQTVLSILAWQTGIELTDPPAFAYRGGESDETFFVADGKY